MITFFSAIRTRSLGRKRLLGLDFDHLGPTRILRSVRHDRDFPGVLMWRDGDGQTGRPFANVFDLEPDRGLEFFARFCRLLHACSVLSAHARGAAPPWGAFRGLG